MEATCITVAVACDTAYGVAWLLHDSIESNITTGYDSVELNLTTR